jgi:hypothetical protein
MAMALHIIGEAQNWLCYAQCIYVLHIFLEER